MKMPLLLNFLRSFVCHVRQQTEVVLLNRPLPTSGSKLALDTVPIQNEIRGRMAGSNVAIFPIIFLTPAHPRAKSFYEFFTRAPKSRGSGD